MYCVQVPRIITALPSLRSPLPQEGGNALVFGDFFNILKGQQLVAGG
jgi:hypothetical protein